jgi:hypothetical protein
MKRRMDFAFDVAVFVMGAAAVGILCTQWYLK